MLSLETLSSVPQQKDMNMHFQFPQPSIVVGGVIYCLGM
jgi:hypothetical protein